MTRRALAIDALGNVGESGGVPSGTGSRASHGAASASPPKASIPNACRDAQHQQGCVKFRKLPVEIEAVRVNAADFNGATWDGNPFDTPAPDWLMEALSNGTLVPDVPRCTDYAEWKIETREGPVWAGPDDWIVRGIEGEIYPCGGDIFERTYEPVGGEA